MTEKPITRAEYDKAQIDLKFSTEIIKLFNNQIAENKALKKVVKKKPRQKRTLTPDTYLRDIKISLHVYNHIAGILSHKKNKYQIQIKDLNDPNVADIRYYKELLSFQIVELKELLFECRIEMK